MADVKTTGGCSFNDHKCRTRKEKRRHTAEQAKLEPARALAEKKKREAREAEERRAAELKEKKQKEIEEKKSAFRREQEHLKEAGKCYVIAGAKPMFESDLNDNIPGPVAEWSCGNVSSLAFMSAHDHTKHDKARLIESNKIVQDLKEILGRVDAGSMWESLGVDEFHFYKFSVLDNSILRNLTTPADAIMKELAKKHIPKDVADIVVSYAHTVNVRTVANAVFGEDSFDFTRISHNVKNLLNCNPQDDRCKLDDSDEEEEVEKKSKKESEPSKRKRKRSESGEEEEEEEEDSEDNSEEKSSPGPDDDDDEVLDEETRVATLEATNYMKEHMIRGSFFEACFPAGARDECTTHFRMFGGLTQSCDLICLYAEVVWT